MSAPAGETAIRSLDDVQPGDILLAPMNSAPTKAIVYLGQLAVMEHVRLGPLAVGHVAICSRPGYVVEAMPSGARQRKIRRGDWAPSHAWVRMPADYPGQAGDAARIARLMIGTPYSFASYAALAAWRFGVQTPRLAGWIDRRHPPTRMTLSDGVTRDVALPVEAICSVLADQAWAMTGKQVMPHGTKPQIVTPGGLALRLWRMPRAVWGGPGLLA